jgi:hypothetical protein
MNSCCASVSFFLNYWFIFENVIGIQLIKQILFQPILHQKTQTINTRSLSFLDFDFFWKISCSFLSPLWTIILNKQETVGRTWMCQCKKHFFPKIRYRLSPHITQWNIQKESHRFESPTYKMDFARILKKFYLWKSGKIAIEILKIELL